MSNFTMFFGNEDGEVIRLSLPQYQFVDITEKSEANDSTKFYLTGEDGLFGGTKADQQSLRVPFTDGERLIDTVMEPKRFQLQLEIKAVDYRAIELARRKIEKIFNPKRPTMVNYKGQSEQKVLVVYADSVPEFPLSLLGGDNASQGVIIDVTAYNPYWQSVELSEVELTAFRPLFEFTSEYWEVPDELFEIGIESSERILDNNGDAAVPIIITMRGPVKNPSFTNVTTGKTIKINTTLSRSDVLVIDTGAPSVKINGDNAFNLLDLSSEFWSVEKGENLVTYQADEGVETATLDIKWRTNFVGI